MVSDVFANAASVCKQHSLNPYCNGTWSLTRLKDKEHAPIKTVLILIVMEHGL